MATLYQFLSAFGLGLIFVICELIYVSKVNTSLDANNIDQAKTDFTIAAGFIYFIAAIGLLGALGIAIASGVFVDFIQTEAKLMEDIDGKEWNKKPTKFKLSALKKTLKQFDQFN